MGTRVVVLSIVAAAVLGAAGLFFALRHSKPLSSAAGASNENILSDPGVARGDSGKVNSIRPTLRAIQKNEVPGSAEADAATAYELVEIDLRCQVDHEASVEGDHARSTTDALCKDLLLDPLSREEIFKAITYAAEHGDIRAQLDYSLHAARIFEDEKNALDPELIRKYKENTVRFLESAGRSGESQAYARLSDIYRNGVLAPEDPVMAYAYAEAYFRTGSSRYGASFLESAMSGLNGEQLRRGKEIANRILSERRRSK